MNKVRDHLGNVYQTFSDMADAYGINRMTLRQRLKKKMPLEEALTTAPEFKNKRKPLTAPDGKEYPSIRSLATAYNMDPATLRYRLKIMTLEDALATPLGINRNTKPITGPDGTEYPSIAALARDYQKPYTEVTHRIRTGWDMKKAMTKPSNRQPVTGPNGKIYPSRKALARAYGISYETLVTRLCNGWSLEEALTRPPRQSSRKYTTASREENRSYESESDSGPDVIRHDPEPARVSRARNIKAVDHLGNEYDSLSDMARAYGLYPDCLYGRLHDGMDLETALTSPADKYMKGPFTDPKGRIYSGFKELAEAWHIPPITLRNRLKAGIPLARALNNAGAWDHINNSNTHMRNTYYNDLINLAQKIYDYATDTVANYLAGKYGTAGGSTTDQPLADRLFVAREACAQFLGETLAPLTKEDREAEYNTFADNLRLVIDQQKKSSRKRSRRIPAEQPKADTEESE